MHVLADALDEVGRQRLVAVVLGQEAPAPTSERSQVDGVAGQLALGDQRVDDLLAGLVGLGAEHLAPPRVEVAHDVAEHLGGNGDVRSEEHTSELQTLMRISYADFCLENKTIQTQHK